MNSHAREISKLIIIPCINHITIDVKMGERDDSLSVGDFKLRGERGIPSDNGFEIFPLYWSFGNKGESVVRLSIP